MNDDEMQRLRRRIMDIEQRVLVHDRMFALLSDPGEVHLEGEIAVGTGCATIIFDSLCATDDTLDALDPRVVRESCEREGTAKAFLPVLLDEAQKARIRKKADHVQEANGIARVFAALIAKAGRGAATGELPQVPSVPLQSPSLPRAATVPIGPAEAAMIETLDRETE